MLSSQCHCKCIISLFQPSIVIHSAAERKPDAVEKQPEATQKLNVAATRSICKQAGKPCPVA